MTYGVRLRELRAERQLSLREVEERGGPNKDTMSLIERGVHKPQPQTLGRIAKALGVGVPELRSDLEAAEHPLAPAPPPQEKLFNNGILEEERRDPTPFERRAVGALQDRCNHLEAVLETARRRSIPHEIWKLESDYALDIAALTLPLIEREHLRPLLDPVVARFTELVYAVLDGMKDAGAAEEAERHKEQFLSMNLNREIA